MAKHACILPGKTKELECRLSNKENTLGSCSVVPALSMVNGLVTPEPFTSPRLMMAFVVPGSPMKVPVLWSSMPLMNCLPARSWPLQTCYRWMSFNKKQGVGGCFRFRRESATFGP